MKKLIKIFLVIIVLFTLGCDSLLDVNHAPYRTEESTVQLVFPAGVVSTCYVFGGQMFLLGSVWSQHWTSGPNAPQYQSIDNYNINVDDFDGRGWSQLYAGALTDYQWVIETAESEENWTYYLMATVMQCYTYHVLVDLYDKIPYTEALQKVAPNFDDGQVVYDGLIQQLDNALSKDLDAATCQKPGEDDIIFGGNMQNWIDFANTLKLKIYLRQYYVNSTKIESAIKELYNSGATFLSVDAAMTQFADEQGHDNPIYGTEWRRFGNQNMVASKTLLDYLTDANVKDPRVEQIFVPTEGEGNLAVYEGMYQGDFRNSVTGASQTQSFSTPRITGTTPVFLISKIESLFLQAEVALRFEGLGDYEALYKAAIDADISYLGVDPTQAAIIYGDAAAAVAGYADIIEDADGMEERLEMIIVQKWIALANKQPIETFFEHNRTGYPRELNIQVSSEEYQDNLSSYNGSGYFVVSETSVLAPPVLYPKRLLFPGSETSANPYTPDVEPVNKKVWWDVRDYPY